ncbi:MAG: type II toxin-antitoxin system RelE family toxin [Pseudonocardiaceae bacterium]
MADRPLTRSPYAITWLPAAPADLLALNVADEQLADAALAALDDVAHHRQRGKALGKRSISGDLSGLYRLRFDAPGQRPQPFRIVYRLTPTERPTTVEVVALGLRADHTIYHEAVARTVPDPSPPSED